MRAGQLSWSSALIPLNSFIRVAGTFRFGSAFVRGFVKEKLPRPAKVPAAAVQGELRLVQSAESVRSDAELQELNEPKAHGAESLTRQRHTDGHHACGFRPAAPAVCELKELIESKEKQLAEIQHKTTEEEEVAFPRRTERQPKPTQKMQAYKMEELNKKENRLFSLYEQWKIQIRKARETLKKDISESELATMADDIENGMNDILKLYHEIRDRVPPSTELRRKIDACEAVTKDILKIVLERLAMSGQFDEPEARLHLHQLLAHEYAHSVYGTASLSRASHHSESSIAAKRTEAAAELAAKEAQYRAMQEEIKQKEKIRLMEEQHKRDMEMQCARLERLQAEKDMEAARARLKVYEREIKQGNVSQLIQPNNGQFTLNDTMAPPTDVSLLAQAIQESITANRLPFPTPSVFSGDPIHYIEWRASFQSLIDQKNISSADKLFYLKKYVSGAAQKCLEGHNAKECRRRLTCDTCQGRHPTCLHDENYKARSGPKEGHTSLAKIPVNVPDVSTAATALNITIGNQSCCTSMIVPVWVSMATDPSKEQLIYALLDTTSDSTFIDSEVSHKLQADTKPVKLKLTTMLGENIIVKCERISGLRVRGYNSCVHIDLPPAYTKDCIPGNRDHIPTHDTARSWPHLTSIADKVPPLLTCDIGLLIGYNCPRALTPRQVLTGKDNEPYAICTDRGWSVVGSAVPSIDRGDVSLCHRVSVKELPLVTPINVLGVLESDFKDVKEDKAVSQEDLLFLDKLKKNIKKNEQGHYEMPLPFRQRPYLPDNRRLAENRLEHLRRKFNRDEKYKKDYTTYMKEIIEREGRKQHKRYGLLFTCFCSRAIHLEMLEDMSTDALINSLRCFISIRGAVRQIRCDQGTNFIGAKNEFKAAQQELCADRLSLFLSQKQCDFVMNAPHSSHAGGVWERQIKTVRSVLNSTLSVAHNRLSDSVLRTVLYEVMAIVNSRPLTVDTLFSPDSLEPLTPNHLIQMKTTPALPPPGTFRERICMEQKDGVRFSI
ncbi:hypothetical protein QQF64_006491 [Cirrhinus molitorella]|uniref:Integrase catalytic domain-containing protein n=1 Tax=Cirrhinus molitorella TaxID=172907 RepID=A0ABR3MF81_9TELE